MTEEEKFAEIRRDVFAAFAMAGMLARPLEGEDDPPFPAIADMAYRMADFMIAKSDATAGERK